MFGAIPFFLGPAMPDLDGHERRKPTPELNQQPAPAAPPAPSFDAGDVVRLKSGGFLMTVVTGHIGCGGVIDVMFASEMGGELTLHEEKVPPECVVKVDYDQAQRIIRAGSAIASSIPF